MAETVNGFPSAGALLGLHALTSLHPGSGTALGTVDLPVQRERHTQWPTISGSALKGVLRDACRESIKIRYEADGEDVPGRERRTTRDKANEDRELTSVFGPPAGKADEHAGALSLTDARLLAFPVRSLKGLFAWVTCPAILERLQRDLGLIGAQVSWGVPTSVANNSVILDRTSPCLVGNGSQVVLEEFEFTNAGDADGRLADWIAETLLSGLQSFSATRERFPSHFAILSDDDFTHFARLATEVSARIGLNYESKTVKKGALFYQEFLPTETLFYSLVLAHGSRSRTNGREAGEILGFLRRHLPAVLQVGGDETTGKGLCATRLWDRGIRETQTHAG